jgi:hypothetical protein
MENIYFMVIVATLPQPARRTLARFSQRRRLRSEGLPGKRKGMLWVSDLEKNGQYFQKFSSNNFEKFRQESSDCIQKFFRPIRYEILRM